MSAKLFVYQSCRKAAAHPAPFCFTSRRAAAGIGARSKQGHCAQGQPLRHIYMHACRHTAAACCLAHFPPQGGGADRKKESQFPCSLLTPTPHSSRIHTQAAAPPPAAPAAVGEQRRRLSGDRQERDWCSVALAWRRTAKETCTCCRQRKDSGGIGG